MIWTPIQKLPTNVGNLGKIIIATNFEWLPKVQNIAQSGHTPREYDQIANITQVGSLFFSVENKYSPQVLKFPLILKIIP